MADFYSYTKDKSGKSLKIYKNADHFCSLKIFLKTTWKKKNKDILGLLQLFLSSDTLAEFAGNSHDVYTKLVECS